MADRQKVFGARLGYEENAEEEATPKEGKLGLSVRTITPEMAERLGIPEGKGVAVTDVKPGSFADDVNLSRGDIILEINRQPVNDVATFNKIQAGLKSGQDVVFVVHPRMGGRDSGNIFLGGTLP